MDRLRNTDIMYLKGVGPARAKLLGEELGIRSLHDLLYHFPNHYADRTRYYSITDLTHEMPSVQIRGRFINFTIQGEGAKTRLVGLFTDGRGTMEIIWFKRIKALREQFRTMTEYVVFGKPTEFNGRWSMVHPEIDSPQAADLTLGLRGCIP